MAKAKTMNRSRNQLATSYAPESFFTFEGGRGACISCSTAGDPIQLSDSTKDLIFERMNDIGRAWFDAAMGAREGAPNRPQVLPQQCVERSLLGPGMAGFQLPGEDRFYLCRPSHMGYSPAPLAFVCRNCGLFRDFETLNRLDAALEELSQTVCTQSSSGTFCDWEQLDVIFVHWSGSWQAPFPGQWQWSSHENKVVQRRDTCVCGNRHFRLVRDSANIGDWYFQCTSCNKPLSQKWLQNDPDTLGMIGGEGSAERLTEARMQVTPYRASSAYYVKTDLFIDFKDGDHGLLSRLRYGREEDLKDFVAAQYGFAAKPLTDDEVIEKLTGHPGCEADLVDFKSAVDSIKTLEHEINKPGAPDAVKSALKGPLDSSYKHRNRVLSDLRTRSILIPTVDMPEEVEERLLSRQELFASKFDPFRLSVEHATVKKTRLDVEKKVDGKRPYVSFVRLDEDLMPETVELREEQQAETQVLLDKLGLADMGLIREFDLCKFSFGYSRMESNPILREKRGMNMPVRLRLFPPVRQNDEMRFPVYVVQQGNEALYVRLKPDVVLVWLQGLDCGDMFSLNPGEDIGAGILGVAQRMGPFLDKLPKTQNPPVYFYLYTLLHSYAHLLMKHVAEYSGLDVGSLGEYIFPADLSFVVYRSGTTMDLGNMSAMWRNSGQSMLKSMLVPKATRCGTGSLCTNRGGACPDCIMVPETSCIAGNKLLSRSVLRSVGGRPKFDERVGSIRGFMDYVNV